MTHLPDMTGATLMEFLFGDAAAEQKKAAIESVTPAMITGEFLADCAQSLLARAMPLQLDGLDVCGTGGDSTRQASKTFNVSTAVAFVVAADGIPVIKHGNRAVSGTSGSSDVLAALNIPICTDAVSAAQQYNAHHLAFVSAPAFHPVLKTLAEVRKSIGRPTFLNLLGPLCNPARTKRQMIGVFGQPYLHPVADAAQRLGKKSVLVLHSRDGLDEISTADVTDGMRLANGQLSPVTLSPGDMGMAHSGLESISCASPGDSARMICEIFENRRAADIIILNAAAAFVVAGRDATFTDGAMRANRLIESGQALQKLHAMQGAAA